MEIHFTIGCLYQNRNLVLSAFGSGAFRVPAKHMAEMLHSLLYDDPEFNSAFDGIYIAILDPYLNTQNYQTYTSVLKQLTVQIDDEVETELENLSIEADEKQNQANEVPQESLSKSQKRRLRKAKQQDRV